MNPLQLYNHRLCARFEDWLAEKQELETAELLEDAWELLAELESFAQAASLPDEVKLANLAYADLNIGPACGLHPAAGYVQLQAVVDSVCAAIGYNWPDTPGLSMDTRQLAAALVEKLRREFEDTVRQPLMGMEKPALILRTGQYLRLGNFYEELQDWLAATSLGRPALLRLYELGNTLDAVFRAYEGTGIAEYLQAEAFPPLGAAIAKEAAAERKAEFESY